jgi:hypothetical protein
MFLKIVKEKESIHNVTRSSLISPRGSLLNPIHPTPGIESSKASLVHLLLDLLSVRETVWTFVEVGSMVFALMTGSHEKYLYDLNGLKKEK